MYIRAGKYPVIVNYRVEGKFYDPSQVTEGQQPTNSDTHSTFPFDSVTLSPGGLAFDRDDCVWVEAKDVTPVADHGNAGQSGE
jgi:hypothetical protein